MPITHAPSGTIVQTPSTTAIHTVTKSRRLAQRAGLRSCAQSLLRELTEQHDHALDLHARALIAKRMNDLHDELVAAMREDVAAIESLSIKSYGPGTIPSWSGR